MPQLNITVNGHSYSVACEAGEEDRLQSLAGLVDEKVSSLARQLGQIGENKLLLMGALLLADELMDRDTGAAGESAAGEANGAAAGAIDSAAERIEDIVARLESH